jgi:ribosomal protein S13
MFAKKPKEIVDQIILDYKNGLSLKQIAKKWKIHEHSVYKYLERVNINPNRQKSFSKKEIKQIIDYYSNLNLTIKQIALKFGVHPETIRRILEKNDVETRVKIKRLSQDQIQEIIKEYQNGKGSTKLAEKYKVRPSTILNWLKKFNVKVRNLQEVGIQQRKTIKPQNGLTKDKALFFGLMLSDGTEKSNGLLLANTDDEFLESFSVSLVKKIYGIEGRKSVSDKGVVWHSMNMLEDVHKYVPSIIHHSNSSTNIPEIILEDPELAKPFLKGYFSCDGSIILLVEKDGGLVRNIVLGCSNIYLFEGICKILQNLGIGISTSNTDKREKRICLTNEVSIKNFREKVSLLPVKVCRGKYWKGCRKDMILDLLLLTYSENFPKKFKTRKEGLEFLHKKYLEMENDREKV